MGNENLRVILHLGLVILEMWLSEHYLRLFIILAQN
jgi:hypothetical protein